MLQIKVFGPTPPCANCRRAEAQARAAAAEFPDQVEVLKLDAMGPEADAYGMMMTPLVVIGDEVVGSGKVIPAKQLTAMIRERLGG
jgi:disulfide oxidoreductase YuzD